MSPRESRAALQLLTGAAVGTSLDLLRRLNGSPEARRAALLDGVPEVVAYYSVGSAALAADFYEEEREVAGVRSRFLPEMVVADRTVKLRRAIAWASDPLFSDDEVSASGRLAEVVQLDTARPFRDTITGNTVRDPDAVGWRRETSGVGCGFCRLLAAKGAIYRASTARFAAHDHCGCTAAPVFGVGEVGPEASALQYVASKRRRSEAEKQALREHIAAHYGGDT